MAGRLGVVWLLYAHQPVGEREAVLEQACRDRYAPILAALTAHPAWHVGLHWSGPLAEWIAARHPELVAALAALVARGQVELIGGGLGAPDLARIPARDRAGQIRAFRTHLERTYGTRVTGAWTHQGLFDLDAPPTELVQAGVEWIPRAHTGTDSAPTPVALLAADGAVLRVLEYPLELAMGLPDARGAERLLDRLRGRQEAQARGVAVRVDLHGDPEPDPAALVDVAVTPDWIEALTPREALIRWRAERSHAWLSMSPSHGSVGDAVFAARLRGVSARCALLPPQNRVAAEARRLLYRAQGTARPGATEPPRPELRSALVASAMRAERLCREALGAPVPALEVRTADLTGDGRDEVLLQTPELAAVVTPHRGGHVVALDHLRAGCDWVGPARWNPEAPPLGAAVDRVLRVDASAADIAGAEPGDESDLAGGVYVARVAGAPDEVRLVLARAGGWRRGYGGRPIRVEKELRCAAGGEALEIRYTVTGGGEGADAACFLSQWTLALLEPDSDDRWLRGPDGARWGAAGAWLDRPDVVGIDAVDESRGAVLELRADRLVRVVTWPVEAAGHYQATAVALGVPIRLGGDTPHNFTLTARMAAP